MGIKNKISAAAIVGICFSNQAIAQMAESFSSGEPISLMKCEIKSGKNVSHDFRIGVKYGNILDEKTGLATLTVKYIKGGEGKFSYFDVYLIDDGSKRIALASTLLRPTYTDDLFEAFGLLGSSFVLRREYRNEWYGAYMHGEFQDDKHILFYQPLVCKS